LINGVETRSIDVVCENDSNLIQPYLLYPARITRWKQQHLAVEILEKLHKKGIKIKLLFAGHMDDSNYWNEIQQKVRMLNLDDYVNYIGTVNKNQLYCLYNNAFAVLSLYKYSNLGNVVIEALTQGSLVVSLNDGSLDHIIINGYNGILVDNMDQAAEQIMFLMESPDSANKIRRNAKQKARMDFKTWEERSDEEINLIINAVSDNL
jgi:glycosyltransferase involved in cell wall biosynthesis